MTAQEDGPVFQWLLMASVHAGDFLRHLAEAALRADDDNYPILRPVILRMMEKYPVYSTERFRSHE